MGYALHCPQELWGMHCIAHRSYGVCTALPTGANSLMPSFQSGFRKFHSTETLLLRLVTDVFQALDQGHVTLLALYDISAAFDTVDHSILLSRVSNTFGITDRALLWFQSFLTDRTISVVSVVFGSNRTPWVAVPYGLPQGSVLAPLLFVLY